MTNRNYKAMSTVSLFVEYADATSDAKIIKAEIVAREPWKMGVKTLNAFDAKVVHALGRKRELTVATPDNNNLKFSKLSFPTPEGASERVKAKYAAGRTELSRLRGLYKEPVHAEASMTDKLHREAKVLAKLTDKQFKRVIELRKAYIAKQS